MAFKFSFLLKYNRSLTRSNLIKRLCYSCDNTGNVHLSESQIAGYNIHLSLQNEELKFYMALVISPIMLCK